MRRRPEPVALPLSRRPSSWRADTSHAECSKAGHHPGRQSRTSPPARGPPRPAAPHGAPPRRSPSGWRALPLEHVTATPLGAGRWRARAACWVATVGRYSRLAGCRSRPARSARAGPVHSVRPDRPGRRAYPQGRQRLPAVAGLCRGLSCPRSCRELGANPGGVAFMRAQAGDDLLAWSGHETAVRRHGTGTRLWPGRSQPRPPGPRPAALRTILDTRSGDWARCIRRAVEFHVRNATAWASAATGEDLAAQIDPDFTLGPRPIQVTASWAGAATARRTASFPG